MAARRNNYVETARRPQAHSGMYIYGNTVRQNKVMPRRRERVVEEPRRKKRVSRQVRQNRKKALHMSPAYVAFLAFAAVIALVACVWYLQMRTELTNRSEHISELQQELADIREENTTRYNSITDSVNLEEVREKSINELGRVYANSDQVVTYQNPVSDYMKQYQDIPKSGVLAQSEQMKK